MRCGYCNLDFSAEEGRSSCDTCVMGSTGCKMLRCPRCGYENPEEPAWARKFQAWRESRKQKATKLAVLQ